MVQFNWSEQVQSAVFKKWIASEGSGVRIAVLDTGVDLSHPALKHLDRAGHKLNAAASGFQPSQPTLSANDNVMDAHRKKGHGTQCTSILAAKPEGPNALIGLAPGAEIFIVKINTLDHKFFRLRDFLAGLEAAANIGVDLVVVSVAWPVEDLILENIPAGEVERVFKMLQDSGAGLLTSLPNMAEDEDWEGVATANFPCNQPASINVGAIHRAAFESSRLKIGALPGVHFLAGRSPAVFAKVGAEYEEAEISSSFATYIVAGVAALYLGSLKKRLGQSYRSLPKDLLMKGIGQLFAKLDANATWVEGGSVVNLFKSIQNTA